MRHRYENVKEVIKMIEKVFNFKMPKEEIEQIEKICEGIKHNQCDQFDCEWYDENDKEHDGSIWIGAAMCGENRKYFLEINNILNRKDN